MKISEKTYYGIHNKPFCSVLMDNYLMKKAVKIAYKYRKEMIELIQNNKEHCINESWSLAYPNGDQVVYNFYYPDEDLRINSICAFDVKKNEKLIIELKEDEDGYSSEVKEVIEEYYKNGNNKTRN